MIYFQIVGGFLAWALSVTVAMLIYIVKKLIKKVLLYLDIQPDDIDQLTSPQSTLTTLSPQPSRPLEPLQQQEAHSSTVTTVFPPSQPQEPLQQQEAHPSTGSTIFPPASPVSRRTRSKMNKKLFHESPF